MIWLMLLAAVPDAGCVPPAPDAQVKVSLKPGSTVDDLARFATATLCRPWPALGTRPLKLFVDGEVSGRQLPGLLRLLAESAGVGLPEVAAPTPRCDPQLITSIVPVDPWTRKISGALRDQLIECMQGQLRIVPNFKGGKAQGFKLFSIRMGSLGEALAFQNGDVVLSVNGNELSTPDQALEVYARLREATEVKFAVLRKGEPRTITWRVR